MVTRHAARLALGALLVVLALACAWSTVAWGQGLDPAPEYPIDLNAIVWGGGSAGAVGGAGLLGWILVNRYGPLVRRGKAPDPVDEPSSIERRVDALEAEQARQGEAMRRVAGEQTRTLLEVKEIRGLAQEILLRLMGGQSG